MINFSKLGIDTHGRTSGHIKTYCPKCRPTRKNKADKPLSVNIDTGVYYCHYCGEGGTAKEKATRTASVYTPVPPVATSTTTRVPLVAMHREWLHAQRGISNEAMDALRLTSAVEYMPQSRTKESCICFNYYENGVLVNTKFRTPDKKFKMQQGAELIPYNIDAIRDAETCIICEGEIDALSFVTAGFDSVISVPSGANTNLNWLERFLPTHFDNKKTIYIAADYDRKGIELRNELIRRLGAGRCRIVSYAEGCKDANENLLKHGADSLKLLIGLALEPPLEGAFTFQDIADEMRAIFENGLERGAETGWTNFDECCTFETGRLCVVTGVPGCGKSEFVDELVLRLNLKHGWKAAYFSPENMPLAYHLRKLAEKVSGCKFEPSSLPENLYGSVCNYLTENITSILPPNNYTLDNILATAESLVVRKGIRLLVIDPYNRLEHQIPPNTTETQYISAQLDSMTNFAQRHNCLIILVAHPRKMNREQGQKKETKPTLYDVNGSANFYNKCDFGLIVDRDREAGVTYVDAKKVKFRHLGQGGVSTFVYNLTNGRYTPCLPGKGVVYDNGSWI
ncbi:bifunctional DNA primase/helicase [Bacteroides sp. 224]|uniref:bifunctional DNA primase/helicase n=1 Tax=Bacteroides sp. 224 TaxID=2302936 RepID=UPI0013D83FA1|nr:bifunctional DNA primase/helicase [Bacteroides sp. 224]NDV63690.1 toprim domain-containing protein [Bacteroides sp. 224]